MRCNTLNKLIIWSLILVAIADIFLLYTEVQSQRCDKIAEQELDENLVIIKEEIESLKKEIEKLKSLHC